MKKRIFEVLDEMHQEDIKNNTRLVGVSNTFLSADKVKQGTKICMGGDDQALQDILSEKCIPVLLLVNEKEYLKRLEEESNK